MTPEENGRLQRLFEDSMSTLTLAVEQLSHDLSQELTQLGLAVWAITDPIQFASNSGGEQIKVCLSSCSRCLFHGNILVLLILQGYCG